MASDVPPAPRFFVLESDAEGRHATQFSKAEPIVRAPAPRCPRCGVVIGMKGWLPPYRAELELHGDDFGDCVQGPGDDLLLSERLAEAFQSWGLSGLRGLHPVELVGVRARGKKSPPASVPRYLAVTACFGRGAVDEARSGLRHAGPPTCPECRSTELDAVHGFTLEPGTWQGEDVFRPRGLHARLVVSERFVEFVERQRLTNLRMTPTEQYVWDPLRLGPPGAPRARVD